jgi:hypothetical protein
MKIVVRVNSYNKAGELVFLGYVEDFKFSNILITKRLSSAQRWEDKATAIHSLVLSMWEADFVFEAVSVDFE